MEDSRLLQSQMTSCPSTPIVANFETLSRDPVWGRISDMAFWWVESSSTSLPPALARLSRPLNLSIALEERERVIIQNTTHMCTYLTNSFCFFSAVSSLLM